MNRLLLNTLVSASLVAAAAPAALAQTANPDSTGPQARHHAQGPDHAQREHRKPSERIEARIAYLKTTLKITDAQQPQWNAFADTLRKQAREANQRFETRQAQPARDEKRTPPTAIERLERRQAMMAAASTRLTEVLAAAKPLYAALSPEQQKIADDLLAPRHGGRFHHRGMHGRA